MHRSSRPPLNRIPWRSRGKAAETDRRKTRGTTHPAPVLAPAVGDAAYEAWLLRRLREAGL